MVDKVIKNATNKELDELVIRLRKENEAQYLLQNNNRKDERKVADKSKTIKESTDEELDALLRRLRKESEVQSLVGDIKRKSEPNSPFGNSVSYERPEVSTEAPIESLYHNADKVLAHFGIPGMKWGVRRKTGPNGLVVNRKASPKGSEDYIKSREVKAKGYKNLSTKELQDLTKRMQLEKQLRELSISDYTKGMEAAKAVLAVGTTAASIYALSTTPMGQAIKKAIIKS